MRTLYVVANRHDHLLTTEKECDGALMAGTQRTKPTIFHTKRGAAEAIKKTLAYAQKNNLNWDDGMVVVPYSAENVSLQKLRVKIEERIKWQNEKKQEVIETRGHDPSTQRLTAYVRALEWVLERMTE